MIWLDGHGTIVRWLMIIGCLREYAIFYDKIKTEISSVKNFWLRNIRHLDGVGYLIPVYPGWGSRLLIRLPE